nr:MAG TPA: hypothetical protein [Caudoviricetes sp.]
MILAFASHTVVSGSNYDKPPTPPACWGLHHA